MSRSAPDKHGAEPGEVATAARIISGAGLVEGFGHVSARSGDGFLMTATRPLGEATAADVHRLDGDGVAAEGATDVPLEAPMHAAVYAARPDIAAICRTHSIAAVIAGARGVVPPLVHGLAGLAGDVRLASRSDLVTDLDAGAEIARDLDDGDCVLMRGNGSIAVGGSLAEAVVRARYLEERCLVGVGIDQDVGWEADELTARSEWFEKEAVRAWAWMQWRYGGVS